MAKHNELGKKGEDFATEYLLSIGYEILMRNYRYGHCEIDIIAKDNTEKDVVNIVFVEVKTRTRNVVIDPSESVTAQKQIRLASAAQHYIQENDINIDARFDVITIVVRDKMENKFVVNHIKDAFMP